MIAPNSFLGISGSKFFFEKDKKVIIEIKYTFQEKFRNEFTYKWRLLLASKTRLLRYIVYVLCFYTITLIIIIVIDFDGLRNFHKKANAFVMEWLMDIIGLMFFVRFSFRLLNYAVFYLYQCSIAFDARTAAHSSRSISFNGHSCQRLNCFFFQSISPICFNISHEGEKSL